MLTYRSLSVVIVATLGLTVGVVRADSIDPVDAALERVREMFATSDLIAARDLLKSTYEAHPRADLLFALGQVEFNLENFSIAVDYYERFIETNPDPDQAALAQQAIGAARARITAPRPPPPPPSPPPRPLPPVPRFERDWDRWSTSLTVLGSLAILGGTGSFVYGFDLGKDHGGTLREYDARLDRSRTWQWTGVGIAAGGVLLLGTVLVRYGIHEIEVTPTSSGVALGGAW